MGKLAEFLTGCPPGESAAREPAPWESFQEFCRFMIGRMYILLTRPREAIREFGAGNYMIPFMFFLFFTIILGFFQSLAGQLQLAIINYDFLSSAGETGGFDIFMILVASSIWPFIQGILNGIILSFLLLGVSLIILTTGIWFITGTRSWNPVFAIGSYCVPIPLLLYTILACVQIPRVVPESLSEVLGLACAVAGVLFMVLIAGYGINALTKIPLVTAGILALFWALIGILLIWYIPVYMLIPVEDSILDLISQTCFPASIPAAAGNNP